MITAKTKHQDREEVRSTRSSFALIDGLKLEPSGSTSLF
jgi:hypothetical protein